jgi:hypothetical protein
MAGENVQFEESQDKNCVKNLERWNNNRDQTGDRHSPQHCSKGEEVGIPPPPPPPFAELSYFGGWQVYDTHLYWTPLPSPLLISDSNTARQTGWQEAIGWQGLDRRQAVTAKSFLPPSPIFCLHSGRQEAEKFLGSCGSVPTTPPPTPPPPALRGGRGGVRGAILEGGIWHFLRCMLGLWNPGGWGSNISHG